MDCDFDRALVHTFEWVSEAIGCAIITASFHYSCPQPPPSPEAGIVL